MSEQSNEVTLKIDPSIKLGDYEPTVEVRKVSRGDNYVGSDCRIDTLDNICESSNLYIVVKKKPWVPKLDEKYFFINYSGVNETQNQETEVDRKRLEVGNYFKTRELGHAAIDLAMSATKE